MQKRKRCCKAGNDSNSVEPIRMRGLRMQLSGRGLALQVQGPGFGPYNKQTKKGLETYSILLFCHLPP
jgi:hypothetical protein